jgi:hypothetical protein
LKMLKVTVMGVKNGVLIAALIVLFSLFFYGGPNYDSSRSFKEFWNFGHIIFFAVLAYYTFGIAGIGKSLSLYKKLFSTIIFSFVLGVLIEFIQYGINRGVDIGDVLRGVLGGLFGLFLSPVECKARVRFFARSVLGVFVFFQAIPWLGYLIDEHNAALAFPVLSDFESGAQSTRWSGQKKITSSGPKIGNGALEVMLGTERFSGVGLKYFPADWSQYHSLYLDVFSDERDFDIVIRINDRQHRDGLQSYSDRYNKSFKLHKGWNSISVNLDDVASAPLTRKANLSDIEGLGIFVVALTSPSSIFLDNVMLR